MKKILVFILVFICAGIFSDAQSQVNRKYLTASEVRALINTPAGTQIPSVTSGQFGWWSRNVNSTETGTIQPSSADTIEVGGGYGSTGISLFPNGNMSLDGLITHAGKTNADYTETTTASDPTRYWDYRVEVNAAQTASSDYLATLYGRINWMFGDNSNVVMSGVEGVASSSSADESVTLQGGYFRTYISPGSTATARSSFGANISARAGYAGGDAKAAESGTAFVGARIYMAPYFASATNINNFHGLWIFNEHPTIDVTNAVYINSATSGASYTNFVNCRDAADASMFNVSKIGAVTNAGNATLGDAVTDQHIFNGNLTSGYFQNIPDISALTRQHIISGTAKLTGETPFAVKTQMEGGFFAIQVDAGTTIATPFSIYGSESKSTLDRDASDATSLVIGALNKVSIRKAITFAGTAIANYAFVGRDNTSTTAQAYNYYAEITSAGITSRSILGTHADTWNYGIDFDVATFETADIRLQNGETISNAVDGTINLGTCSLINTGTVNGFTMNNGSAVDTLEFGNKYLPLTVVFAAIDSFTTSGQTKEITVTGATVGGAVIVTPAYPAYSAVADTGQQYSGYVKAGGGTIVIVRTNLSAASTIKDAGIFNYVYMKPR
ncbi:MAG: hypothetical protein IMZ53_12985 [Thermoplasmata archaeon]|nr:hypothetical protein [Thermoplasmata archaeon]